MGDKMLPCGIPCSCSNASDRVFPTSTLKDLLDKNLYIKAGSRLEESNQTTIYHSFHGFT